MHDGRGYGRSLREGKEAELRKVGGMMVDNSQGKTDLGFVLFAGWGFI